MAKVSSKIFLNHEDQEHYDKLVRFYRHELHDEEGFKKGVERILAEEPTDTERIGNVYKAMNNEAKSEDFQKKADDLKDYFTRLRFDKEKLGKLINFKEHTYIENLKINCKITIKSSNSYTKLC